MTDYHPGFAASFAFCFDFVDGLFADIRLRLRRRPLEFGYGAGMSMYSMKQEKEDDLGSTKEQSGMSGLTKAEFATDVSNLVRTFVEREVLLAQLVLELSFQVRLSGA